MKVAFYTLGCKVNQNDTQGLADLFKKAGYSIVGFETDADVYIINTCAVTKVGEQKSRQIIRQAIHRNPQATIAVTGCYAQTLPREVAKIQGVNLIIGMADRPKIVELITNFKINSQNQIMVTEVNNVPGWNGLPVSEPLERTRAMLKIEDGCEDYCSYCIVPYARGKVRSMPMEQVVQEYKTLIQKGYQEIVLTGIHLGQYGKDLGIHLNDLLHELIKVTGNNRIRLGSLEPGDLRPELINTIVANSRICQHLHIPLQSGSGRILKLMNRHYSIEEYADLVQSIRSLNPLMAIGTDLIIGFPGETEQDFEEICQFISNQKFSRIHVFRFSPRPGTPAANLPNRIPKFVQEERSKIIQKISAETGCNFAEKFKNRLVEVLFEEKNGISWFGLSGEYLKVLTTNNQNIKNTLQTVYINDLHNDQLIGVITTK